ncbi:MAG: hypothetical protein ACRDN0_40210, partial [Trebonia sp.]
SGPGLTVGTTSAFGTGWTKLLGSTYGPEIGWLFPLAVLALICGLVWTWRARRDDPVRGGFVMWGLWLVTYFVIFSDMSSIPHTAYVASLAPALAALSGAGIVMFWRMYLAGERRGWMLPAAVALSLGWAAFLWRSYPGFLPWARYGTLAVGAAAIVVIIAARLSRRMRLRIVTAGLACGVVATLAAPAAWASSVLDTKYAGSSFNASAGPDGGEGFGGGAGGGLNGPSDLAALRVDNPGGSGPGAPGARSGFPGGGGAPGDGGTGTGLPGGGGRGSGHGRPPSGSGGTGGPGAGFGGGGVQDSADTLTSAERQIYDYVSAHRDGAGYLMAVTSWSEASPYIIATGQEVMPMGGFSGSVPSPTLAQVQKLVHSGQLRFFLLNATGNAGGGPGGLGGGGSTMTVIESWIKKTCSKVPAKDYGGASSTTGFLYSCK